MGKSGLSSNGVKGLGQVEMEMSKADLTVNGAAFKGESSLIAVCLTTVIQGAARRSVPTIVSYPDPLFTLPMMKLVQDT